jgi:hypothetical protein
MINKLFVKTIYRIENKRGYGPYVSHNQSNWADFTHTGVDENHPGPEKDLSGLNKLIWLLRTSDLIFGFNSIDQINNWFSSDERRKLFALGYNVVKIKIKYHPFSFLKGKRQVLFTKKNILSKEDYYFSLDYFNNL